MRPSGARVHVVWKVKMQERDKDRSSEQISAQLEWANSSSPPCAATPPATWRRGGCHGACGPSQFHLTHTLHHSCTKGNMSSTSALSLEPTALGHTGDNHTSVPTARSLASAGLGSEG